MAACVAPPQAPPRAVAAWGTATPGIANGMGTQGSRRGLLVPQKQNSAPVYCTGALGNTAI
ncbi:MAG: hypothetical protein PHG73_00620 [Pygmaiobacter sp.]|nr:hypothetical protein [Pygmaiobacter sp.]